MNNMNHIIDRLITGNPHPGDEQALKLWLSKSEDNQKEFDRQQRIWKQAGHLKVNREADVDAAWLDFQSRLKTTPVQRSGSGSRSTLRMAAGLALIIGLSILLTFLIRGESATQKIAQLDGGPSTVEIMPEIAEFPVEEQIDSILLQGESMDQSKAPKRPLKRTGLLVTYTTQDSAKAFYLPDSSIVFLNDHSSLAYKQDFGKTNRNLNLKGEAYFEVAPHALPFAVTCGKTVSKGFGTYFNVRQDVRQGQVEVLNVSGSLDFTGIGKKEVKELNLKAGEKVSYTKDEVLLKQKNTNKNYKWWQAKNLRASLKAFINKLKTIFY